LRIEPFIIAILMGLCSCERPEPVSEKPEEHPESPANPGIGSSLAAAQLALAKFHLANNEAEKAIPFLQAATQGAVSGEAKGILTETLESQRFSIPSVLLRHPHPVLCFSEDPGKAIFVALGGKHPTVVRWDLSETPEVTAVLFPTNAADISHISLSSDGLHLLVHRDATNLLCDSATLKPIANLGPFPGNLDPDECQPFTANGLLVAHPVKAEDGSYLWHIRDSATGQILRSELLLQYPEPREASFDGTNLTIGRTDGTSIIIPIRGDAKSGSPGLRIIPPPTNSPTAIKTAKDTIALLKTIPAPPPTLTPSPALLSAISGYELDPATQMLLEIPIPDRLEILSETFPETIPSTLKLFSSEPALNRRLAAAYPEEFPKISAPQTAHAEIIRKTFESGDPAAISAVIDSAQHGLPLATALFLSLESGNPSFIGRAAAKAGDMPAALRNLATNGTPPVQELALLRTEQDWLGYESPDFSPIFRKSSERKSLAISHLSLPEKPSVEDIDSLILKLVDPKMEAEIGRPALAESAIGHASVLAMDPELASHALNLSAIAQRFGSNPALCLRTNATAFTSTGDFTSAHRTWIDLITNQPEADHLASDYSEAAYTAFETGDARQAMEILHTGLFRFQNDVAFAIRAGWIALLTDHSAEALTYLTHATKLGLPPAEIENTTALLAITQSQLGDSETAESYLAQLKAISPKWEDAQNIDALPWPETLKATLREIISQQPETEPGPSPESDPTHTAPRSGEFPIPEPPLPSR